MGDESVAQLSTDNIDEYVTVLFEKIENLRNESLLKAPKLRKVPVRTEMRTLEFWRSVISECLASFCYVFIVCGASAGAGPGASVSSVLLATSLAAGFAVSTLTQCFGHISGAHINPAVTIASLVSKRISLIRSVMFIIAQCGGGIAGAAFLYGMNVPGYQTNLAIPLIHPINPWERFGVELILTFIVVLTYLVSMETYSKWLGNSSLIIGAAYTACTFVSIPYLNPARSLGPSFVLTRWDNHWVYWMGPLAGGLVAGVVYEYILNSKRYKRSKDSADGESSSIQSDADTYDDLDKPPSTSKYFRQHGGLANSNSGYCQNLMTSSLYAAAPCKSDRAESIYGGTKSLYCKSPPLTRANLNRSQSVYTKSNSALNRELLPRPGPLVPAQSLYPMRLNHPPQQAAHLQNQNLQNQMQQRSESSYAIRGLVSGSCRSDPYGTISSAGGIIQSSQQQQQQPQIRGPVELIPDDQTDISKPSTATGGRSNRPESMYGIMPQRHAPPSATSEDSGSYSYYSSSKRTNGSERGYPVQKGGPPGGPGNGATAKHPPPGPPFHHVVTMPQHSPSSY